MATIQYVVNAVDAASATFARIAGSADEVLHKLDDIGKKSATARVALAGDKEASLTIDKLDLKLASLGKKVATGKIGVEGQARALLQIKTLEASLDRLGAKDVTATVHVKVDRSALGRLRGLLGGLPAIGAGAEGAPGAAGGLGGLLGPAAVGAGIVGAGLVPGAVGLGIGGLAGLGAIGGGLLGASQGKTTLAADKANISALTTQLKSALGAQRATISAELMKANKQYAKDAAFFQPFSSFQASISHLMQTVLAPLRSVMTPLAGIFNQFGKGLTGLGPQFTALFKASLPFIKQFLDFMLQAGKILLPAFTTAMNQMVKSGALKQITQALVVLTQGLADFIVALGPGMDASAKVFARVVTFISRALGPLGTAFSKVAEFLTADWSPAHLWNVLLDSAKAFFSAVVSSARAFGRAMSSSFDALRHDIATIWDTIWRNTITRMGNGVRDAAAIYRSLIRLLAGVLSTLRSNIAGAWNTIWANTITRIQNGITTAVNWFRGMTGRVVNALTGLGHSLGSFAAAALNEMWNGFKRIGGNILGWFGGFAKSIISVVKKVLGVFSPSSVFFDIGVNLMRGLEHGVKHGVTAAQAAAKAAAQSTAAAGRAGAGVQQWRGVVLQALRMEGLSPGLLADVLYQMQTESGGNPRAINLTDINAQMGTPSKGLMQVIDPTFRYWHWPGTSWNIYDPLANIAAAINYGAHGKGFGSGIGQIGSGHGYALGGIITEPIWGIGASGRQYSFGERGPETVTPGTGHGGPGMSTARVEALLAQILRAVQVAPAATSAGTARALNSAARAAVR